MKIDRCAHRHAAFERLDAARSIEAARRLNQGWAAPARVGANADPLLKLLQRFQNENVKYILVGGRAVRLNGFLRSAEDIDILLPASIENGYLVSMRRA